MIVIFIYNVLFSVSLIIALPFLLIFLSKEHLRMRLGIYEKGSDEDYLWFHFASVGEVDAAKPLIAGLKNKYPHTKFNDHYDPNRL